MRKVGFAAVLMAMACAAPALADDPRDPAMTPEAVARDRETIRRLNRDQLDYVRQRDAGYAQGWRDHAGASGDTYRSDTYTSDRRDYAAARADYTEQRRRYEADMRAWREDVAACRAGYYAHCDQR